MAGRVEAIRLQNFMAFRDTGWIELRPITLLFGRNSSGKSVIIRALRLLKQSLPARPGEGPLVFAAEGGLDQDGFKNTVHLNAMGSLIGIHFRCRLDRTLDDLFHIVNESRAAERQPAIRPDAEERWAELRLAFAHKPGPEAELASFDLVSPWPAVDGTDQTTIFSAILDGGQWVPGDSMLQGHLLDGEDSPWSGVSIGLLSGFLPTLGGEGVSVCRAPHSFQDYQHVRALLEELCTIVSEFLSEFEWLSPLRPEPQRQYVLDSLERQRWEQRGLGGFIQFLRGDLDQGAKAEMDHWMSYLTLGQQAEANDLGYSGKHALLAEVQALEGPTVGWVNYADVGFGLSQALPVIVESLVAERYPLLIIEQPELHLHARAQAGMADLFIRMANRGARFLLETHSENLLLRLRRRIAETSAGIADAESGGRLGAEQLAAYFIGRGEAESVVTNVRIRSNGDMDSLPEGFDYFFSEDIRDVLALTAAALRTEKR